MNPEKFIGKIIGNYEIKEIIGEGAFSTVCLSKEVKTKENKEILQNAHYVACKIVPRTKTEQKKLTTRLDQEIHIHRLMHHQNVIQLIDVQKDSSFFYLFLEFVPCEELLQKVLKKFKLPEFEAAIYFKQILIGLQYIHSLNVAHRDLKPENILVDQFGRVKITDFGLSKLIDNDCNGLTKTPCGSLCYSSPECFSGFPYDGKKSDIWSCGVILFVLTTGYLPWSKKSSALILKQIRKGDFEIPSYLSFSCADLIQKLMTVDPNKRITIDDALNHPFLKCVFIPPVEIDHNFVSLRKIDRLFENDQDLEYDNMNLLLQSELSESDSIFKNKYLKIRKKYSNLDSDKIKKKLLKVNSMEELSDINEKNNNNYYIKKKSYYDY